MSYLHCQADLDASLLRLVALDARLVPLLEQCEPIALRRQPAGLEGLLQIILAQQVSVASARAIWQKFTTRFPGGDVQLLADASEEDLRSCTLSRPKIKTVQRIIEVIKGGFDLDALAKQDPSEIRRALISLHGVGPWTADVYLLFCLGQADIFPAGDLALQVSVASALGLDDRPGEKALAAMAEALWAPERGAAAHLFWAFYRQIKKGREGVL
ncbi:DNA-3-methyladenine glycosylase 2 family protein [uncultured Cohaesibacter sp.]|uniref:DNA-3-methyladenine glycosylase family protein n=1 Tax=uncultured Cohaesibacter sp. TaxID=1002546 RepID=UPI002AAAC31E|nr:DNA-3-methyladenine glycosylase 2 family protein [uncultured Cohaesibacter sp.]